MNIIGPTVIARESDDPPAYSSSDVVNIDRMLTEGILDATVTPHKLLTSEHPYITDHPLVHARARAIERKLYVVGGRNTVA